VRNNPDNLGHVAMRLEPDPLDPVGTGLKTGDVNSEVRDMMLLSTRLRVWNPDVVVPPSELRCHGRRLMVQSLSDHPRLSLSIPLIDIAIKWPVESAERERDKQRQGVVAHTPNLFRQGAVGFIDWLGAVSRSKCGVQQPNARCKQDRSRPNPWYGAPHHEASTEVE